MNGLGSCFGIRVIFLMIAISCHFRKESHSKKIEFSHLQWVLSMGKHVAMKSIDLTRKNQPYSATSQSLKKLQFLFAWVFWWPTVRDSLEDYHFRKLKFLRSQKRVSLPSLSFTASIGRFFLQKPTSYSPIDVSSFSLVFFLDEKKVMQEEEMCLFLNHEESKTSHDR